MTTLPAGAPVIRVTAMPADANPYGDIFGGWLMGHMDLAAGSVASRHAHGRAVTIAVDAMKFHRPDGQWYEQTIAEVWFRTAEAAEAAGFVEAGK